MKWTDQVIYQFGIDFRVEYVFRKSIYRLLQMHAVFFPSSQLTSLMNESDDKIDNLNNEI